MRVEARSVYRMVLRYTNPNADAFVGEVTVSPIGGYGGEQPAGGEGATAAGAGAGGAGGGVGDTQTHQVLLSSTGEANPTFVTVSGDKGIYAVPFDLEAGDWTVAVKIVNDDPAAEEILVVCIIQ